jgi:hypothetical protein
MRTFILVLAILVGCTHSKTPAYAVGGVAATAGAVLVAGTAARPDCTGFIVDELACDTEKGGMYILGALLLTAGLTALAVAAAIEVPDHPEAPLPEVGANPFLPPTEVPEPASEDPQLRELTLQASLAARVGRCHEVGTIANTVDSLDRGYRIAGFVRDPKVRACLH